MLEVSQGNVYAGFMAVLRMGMRELKQ